MNLFRITIQRRIQHQPSVEHQPSAEHQPSVKHYEWPLVVERSRRGILLPIRHESTFHLTSDDFNQLYSLLGQPREYGTHLGKALFQGEIHDAFVRACGESPDGLRVLLFIEADDTKLRTLRWERLCVPIDGQWELLVLAHSLPFSLYIPSGIDRRFPPIGKRDLRALIIAASPENLGEYSLDAFDVKASVAGVREALGEIPSDVLAPLADALGPPTLDELCHQLTDHSKQYTLLHIIGHGRLKDGDTALYWANAANQVEVVIGQHLIQRLRSQESRGLPHFAFLATCESASSEAASALGGLGQRLVRDLGIPAVIAMTDEVTVTTALSLGQHFYQQLRVAGYVDLALDKATAGLADRYDITVPALFSRLADQPLFSDSLDRPLTNAEIRYGLKRLSTLLTERAPVLQVEFDRLANQLQNTLATDPTVLSPTRRQEREQALEEMNTLCQEVSDINFNALAFDQTPPDYEARCPFLGLYPFHDQDRELFFGRDTLIKELHAKLIEHRFLAVLGPSGSGKSSIVLAGVVPKMQAQSPELQIAYLTPSSEPVAQLTQVQEQVSNSTAVVWVVDQFEELFTLCTKETQRQQFIEQLLSLNQQQPVIIIMRADFWGECAPYEALTAQMTARQSLIPPMNTAELRSAMEQQAAKVGLRFEADLSNTILDEVKDEPGAMPLLQHGLRELWNRRHGSWLKTAEYREGIGGIKSAIAKTADEVYFRLSLTERKQFQNIFIRLTRLDDSVVSGEGHRDTRRRVELEELVPTGTDLSAIKKLVSDLANARLVVTSVNLVTHREEVEVAHEALIRYWPRLANWLNENRTDLQLRETIRQAALAWEENQRKEDFLVHRGVRLESAEGLAQQAEFLNQLEAAYVQACANLQYRERKEKEEQQEKRLAAEQEARHQAEQRAKQFRLWSVALSILLVLAIIAWGWALYSEQKAKESEQKAKKSEQKAKESEQKAKKSEIETLSVSSDTLFQLNQTFDALLNGLTAAIKFQQAGIQDSELEPKVYSGLQNALYGVKECNTLEDDKAPIASANFSPKGGILATINTQGRLILWKQEEEGSCRFSFTQPNQWNTQQQIGHYKFRQRLRFNPQGDLIAVTGTGLFEQPEQRGVKLWKLDGTELEEFSQASMRAIFLPPDGQRFISARRDRTVQIWSTDNNQNNKGFICQIEPNIKSFPTELSVSKNGQWLALASKQGIKLWKIDTSADCEKLRSSEKLVSPSEAGMKDDCKKLCFSQQPSPINDDIKSIDFSPDNQLLVAANENGTLELLDLSGDKPLTTPYDHRGRVNLVRFSPDKNNQRLASAGEDKTIKLWNREGTLLDTLGGHKDSVTSVDFSPDGKMLASTSLDSTVKLWLLDSKLKTTLLRKHKNAARDVLFSQDGQKLAILSDNDTIMLWQQKNGEWIYNNPKKDKNLNNLHFLQNDQALLATSDDKLNIWSLLDDKPTVTIEAETYPRFYKNPVSINSNHQIIATASQDKVKLWHTDGKLVTELKGHQTKVTTVTFSPDGQFLASADNKGTIKLWHWDDNAWEEKTLPPSPHTSSMTNLVFSPNSKMLLSANDGKITLWQQQVEQSTWLLRDLSPSHKSKVNSVAFSSDSQLLVTADQGGEGRLWKVADSKDIKLIGHTAAINKVLFFKSKQLNRQLIATASNDNTIKFWELDGTLLTTFKGHQGGVTAIDFSPTGEFFASASEDQVILWDISKLGTLKTLIKQGCLWIKDYLLTDRKNHEILKEECDKITVE